MSAPTSHDPLVVTTEHAGSWWRRAYASDGHGLYARAESTELCPELLTVRELAEFGLRGMADCLPMPTGPEPRDVEEELTGANLSLWEEEQETARLRLALVSAQRGRRELRARVAELERVIADAPASYVLMDRARAAADRLTRTFAPTQVLRAEDEFGLHHDYRVPRDLPESDGAQ